MSRMLKIALLSISGVALVLLAAAGWAYLSSRTVPPFYAQALARPADTVHEDSDALVRKAAGLFNDLRKSGRWQALFTADQINGWLADDLLKNYPSLLPPTITEPRVAIENGRLMLGFRWHQPNWTVVVSAETEVYLRHPNTIAVRVRKLRAGNLPLPLKNLLNELAASGRKLDLQIVESEIDGDPLLLITPPQDRQYNDLVVQLDSLELRDGQLHVSGRSQRGTQPLPPVAERPRDAATQAAPVQSQ